MTFDEITEDGRLWAVRYAEKNKMHCMNCLINGMT